MYCPKCKQNFDEGSRRFCPTDGARLVSEAGSARREGGIFANLIPKIDAIADLDQTRSDVSRFGGNQPEKRSPATSGQDAANDIFFELDDLEPELELDADFLKPVVLYPVESETVEQKPVARKINPYEIPAGHVDLGDSGRTQGIAADFDEGEPESFVGRIVKGRYKVTEFLGGDETGLAYLADDKIVDDKKVLVRILTGGESDEIMDSIIAEERVSLSHFSHPNIARLIDSGQFNGGTDFIISEYVDALSVDDILSIHGPFGPARVARVIRQAASALNEAHQEGIIHRDLRSGNLIIDASSGDPEQTKLVNFGASSGEPNALNMGYKAPEVIEGRIATAASDIFSLAAVAYEMLTGQMPFDGETPRDLVRSQNAGLTALPMAIRPELTASVDEVLVKALSLNPANRYVRASDFGDALYTALADLPQHPAARETVRPVVTAKKESGSARVAAEQPIVTNRTITPAADEPAWKNRSPEPPTVESSRSKMIAVGGILALVAVIAAGWYYIVNNPLQPDVPQQPVQTVNTANDNSQSLANTEMPPMPRSLPQPPNTNFYQNSKQNLKGDLLRNFVGFTMYYPKDWKVNGPQASVTANTRGKFLDISRSTADDRLKEQMLISYYPSKGTFSADEDKFPQLVKETNDTLKKLLPGYQMVSEGEIKINGDWRAYEVKFQGGGTSPSGEKLVVWGRRLFIPASRPGVRNGFEITMLATSLADDVHSVDDVAVKGELASVLYSFEPSQNF